MALAYPLQYLDSKHGPLIITGWDAGSSIACGLRRSFGCKVKEIVMNQVLVKTSTQKVVSGFKAWR